MADKKRAKEFEIRRAKGEQCHADRDGECSHRSCPQLRDKEPGATGRHCPLDDPSDYEEL